MKGIINIQQKSTDLITVGKDKACTIDTNKLKVRSRSGKYVEKLTFENKDSNTILNIKGDFPYEGAPYFIEYEDLTFYSKLNWRLKDKFLHYSGPLGCSLNEDGSAVLTVWSPSATLVSVRLYDALDQEKVIGDFPMEMIEKGAWQLKLDKDLTGIDNHDGYFYHYIITRNNEEITALDPYAKSLAQWDYSMTDNLVAKAAIVDIDRNGPSLDYADIPDYTSREQAIIYEAHVRDMTSDPDIADELDAPYGTFTALIEKLDYIKDLGVTHIQLLPVMSYYLIDENERSIRLPEYDADCYNYNWGYDPQSYFALTGMYTSDPKDPNKRIEEFKELVNEIHKRGMGVILDVVYNHTARVHILEDLEPNYYHFMNLDGSSRESFGGGRLGSTHAMTRRLIIDSITHWVDNYKVDGFRFDMMGDLDAETVQLTYDEASKLNPNTIMIGEGWLTYVGDADSRDIQAADQHWMKDTSSVASFSDDFRDELKGGFNSEGLPRFLSNGARNINHIFDNICARPRNFKADEPGDVVQYIECHDNMTLHDVIAMAIKKDPVLNVEEIQKRIRIGNLIILTSQGTAFIHAGQEYGRTKQFRHPKFKDLVSDEYAPHRSMIVRDYDGNPIDYPYFIHDSYTSSDAINRFEWNKALDSSKYPHHVTTRKYTQGLISIRRSTNAFTLKTKDEVNKRVKLIKTPEVKQNDLAIAYEVKDTKDKSYYILINADEHHRSFTTGIDFTKADILVDAETAGTTPIYKPQGIAVTKDSVTLAPLTACVFYM